MQFRSSSIKIRQLLQSGNAHYIQADMSNDKDIEMLVKETRYSISYLGKSGFKRSYY